MAYPKRDWANTGNEVTKEDFKRIENGIEANDIEITKQKNPTIPGTLAKKIADNVTAIEENANKINVLSSTKSDNITLDATDLLAGGWVVFGMGHSTFGACRSGNIVTISGVLKGGLTTDGTTLIVLPEKFKPSYTQTIRLITKNDSNLPRANINTDGSIVLYGVNGISTSDFLVVSGSYLI